MKHNNSLQHFAQPKKTIPGHLNSSQTVIERFCLSESYRPDIMHLPAIKADTCRYESPVKKINIHKTAFHPFFNVYLKETAACLSDLELAIDNDDTFMFQCAIHSLIDLFSNLSMPAAIGITRQMEEMAAENKFQEAKEQLLKVKKIIAAFA